MLSTTDNKVKKELEEKEFINRCIKVEDFIKSAYQENNQEKINVAIEDCYTLFFEIKTYFGFADQGQKFLEWLDDDSEDQPHFKLKLKSHCNNFLFYLGRFRFDSGDYQLALASFLICLNNRKATDWSTAINMIYQYISDCYKHLDEIENCILYAIKAMWYSTFISTFKFDQLGALENQIMNLLKKHPDKINSLATGLIYFEDYQSADSENIPNYHAIHMLGFHYTRGFCYEQLGLPEIALACYQQIKPDPDFNHHDKPPYHLLFDKAKAKVDQLSTLPSSEKTIHQLALERMVIALEDDKESYAVNKRIEDGINWIKKQYPSSELFKAHVLSTIYYMDEAYQKSYGSYRTFSIPLLFASINMWRAAEPLLIQGTRQFINHHERYVQPEIQIKKKNFCFEKLKERKQEKLLEFEKFLTIIIETCIMVPDELKEIIIDYYGFRSFVFFGRHLWI